LHAALPIVGLENSAKSSLPELALDGEAIGSARFGWECLHRTFLIVVK
jgi:hypothetical protein